MFIKFLIILLVLKEVFNSITKWKYFFFLIQEKDITLSGEHVREGLTCIISVKVPNPEFEGQTKVLLVLLYSFDVYLFIYFYWVSCMICSFVILLYRFNLLQKDEVGKSRGEESSWSICSRVSYWILGVASRCAWFNSFQVPKCSQGIFV